MDLRCTLSGTRLVFEKVVAERDWDGAVLAAFWVTLVSWGMPLFSSRGLIVLLINVGFTTGTACDVIYVAHRST